MRKLFFTVIAALSLNADPGALVAKVIPNDSNGYFIFNDGSFWKVSSFVMRWRTPIEWISGDELYVPEDYECTMDDWSFGDLYEVYYKVGNLRVDESHASNESDLKKHSLLMMNLRNGKFFFATQMQPGDYVKEVYDLAYDAGKSKGYNKGYNDGYSIGFKNGKNQVLRDLNH